MSAERSFRPFTALLLLGLLVACRSERAEPPATEAESGASAPESPAAPPLALYRASAEGPQALLRGELVREGDCLYIVADEGGERFLLALPSPGSRWRESPAALELGGHLVRPGETVTVAGGESGLRASDWLRAPAQACDTSSMWLVTGVHQE